METIREKVHTIAATILDDLIKSAPLCSKGKRTSKQMVPFAVMTPLHLLTTPPIHKSTMSEEQFLKIIHQVRLDLTQPQLEILLSHLYIPKDFYEHYPESVSYYDYFIFEYMMWKSVHYPLDFSNHNHESHSIQFTLDLALKQFFNTADVEPYISKIMDTHFSKVTN